METAQDMECSPAELERMLREGPAPRLVDVREPAEWEIVHLEGGELLTQQLLDDMLANWDKGTAIVCYCHHGVRSLQTAQFLQQQGFTNVRSMSGGVDAWAREVDSSMDRY